MGSGGGTTAAASGAAYAAQHVANQALFSHRQQQWQQRRHCDARERPCRSGSSDGSDGGSEAPAAASGAASAAAARAAGGGGADGACAMVVGYRLTKKKTKSFLKGELLEVARSRGIEFREIDESLPLSAQGPFDAIIHKVREINGTSVDAWDSELEEFMRRHPETIVVDHPAAIRRLSNRASMLQAVPHTLELPKGRVAIPRQLVVRDTGSETIPEMVARAGLSLPLVAKPLLVDGSISSHRLALVTEERGLQALQTPLVLQEFVNHGGVLFKVNVVGESVTVVKRSSLPDWSGDGEQGSEDDLDEVTDSDAETPSVLSPESCERDGRDGVRLFERVSSAKYSDLQQRNGALPRAEAPPEGLIAELSQELTSRLGLQLFNFDLIRDSEDPDNYYVIDINYFPGFAKMPEYEAIFTDFLLNLRKPSERAGHRLSSSALAAGFRKEGCGIEERSVCA